MSISLLIGVVGHRDIPSEYVADLEEELSGEIDKIISRYPDIPIAIVSSLALGADRIGGRVALAKGLNLIVPLPFSIDRYEQDFPDSVEEFRLLNERALYSFVVDSAGFSGYEAASRWISSHCQLVIALWDGKEGDAAPGGTAHTISLRRQIKESGGSLASIADLMGPVIHLHAPREQGVVRNSSRWYWPEEVIDVSPSEEKVFLPLDTFNREANLLSKKDVDNSLKQFPEVQLGDDPLTAAFAHADAMANMMQAKIYKSLLLSVVLFVFGYVTQQVWGGAPGRMLGAILFLGAWFIVQSAKRNCINDRYLEYRALAEVLRIAYFRRMAGLMSNPTEKFLNQHFGQLRWIRGAVNSLWIPNSKTENKLDYVKKYWIDEQRFYYDKKSTQNFRYSELSDKVGALFFVSNVILSWVGVFNYFAYVVVPLSGVLAVFVGAIGYFSHVRGWKDDGLRFSSMSVPFSWCHQVWECSDSVGRQSLVNDLSIECLSEISSWLLAHRTRSLEIMKA